MNQVVSHYTNEHKKFNAIFHTNNEVVKNYILKTVLFKII
jgi:hypothetical protein